MDIPRQGRQDRCHFCNAVTGKAWSQDANLAFLNPQIINWERGLEAAPLRTVEAFRYAAISSQPGNVTLRARPSNASACHVGRLDCRELDGRARAGRLRSTEDGAANATRMPAFLVARAAELGLDLVRFERDLDSGRFKVIVQKDVAEGRRLGVTGTPTFFVNGRRLVGAQPLEVFKQVVEEELRTLSNGPRIH